MTTTQEYQKRLTELSRKCDVLVIASSVARAKANLAELEALEEKILYIEKSILRNISALREHLENPPKRSFVDRLFKQQTDQVAEQVKLQHYEAILQSANALRSRIKQEIVSKLESTIAHAPDNSTPPVVYKEYINSLEWRHKAEEAKAQAGNRCQLCNRSRAEVQLDAHHRTYERLGDEKPEDITILCRDCHQLFEDNRRMQKAPRSSREDRQLKEERVVYISASHTNASNTTANKQQNSKEVAGYCIRCKTEINLNPVAPYCRSCFRVWKRFENSRYTEVFCHICGDEHQTSKAKPACYHCYKDNVQRLAFPEA